MSPQLEAAIKSACVEAVAQLGDSYKQMSCFLFNWQMAKNTTQTAAEKKVA